MNEEIRHLLSHSLGLCGEGHPSLLALLGYLAVFLQWIKFRVKEIKK